MTKQQRTDNLRIAYRLDQLVDCTGQLTTDEECTLTSEEQESLRIIHETLRAMKTHREQGWEWKV